jgi:hypothetical protein
LIIRHFIISHILKSWDDRSWWSRLDAHHFIVCDIQNHEREKKINSVSSQLSNTHTLTAVDVKTFAFNVRSFSYFNLISFFFVRRDVHISAASAPLEQNRLTNMLLQCFNYFYFKFFITSLCMHVLFGQVINVNTWTH